MRRDAVRGTSVTRVFMFRDPDGRIARLLERGVPVEDAVMLFRDALVGRRLVTGNVFLNEGIQFIWKAVTGASGLTYFGSNSCIGVGDGTAAEDPAQTGLTGTNKAYKQVDSGYPQLAGSSVRFRATFGPNEAAFAWNEWTVANGCGDGYVNLNRKAATLGTKPADATWVIEVMLSIS
jgi:hypothetical protein